MRKSVKLVKLSSDAGQGDQIKDIIEAAMNGDAKLVAQLLEQGSDINTVESERGFTCLHIACMNGDQDVLAVLTDHHRIHNDLDFSIKSNDPPRLAWQLAMGSHHYDIANEVDEMAKRKRVDIPSGPRLIR